MVFTSGNINDSKMIEKASENMKGWFYRDAGYLKRREELVRLARWMAFSGIIVLQFQPTFFIAG